VVLKHALDHGGRLQHGVLRPWLVSARKVVPSIPGDSANQILDIFIRLWETNWLNVVGKLDDIGQLEDRNVGVALEGFGVRIEVFVQEDVADVAENIISFVAVVEIKLAENRKVLERLTADTVSGCEKFIKKILFAISIFIFLILMV
jgi:hypothetical protein